MRFEEVKDLSGKLCVAAIFSLCLAYVFLIIDSAQPSPYMDEVFHVPQARNYCNGSFSKWDPMITTPPGLYLVSVGLLKPVSSLLDVDMIDICSTKVLRCTNILFTIGNFFILHALVRCMNHHQNGSKLCREVSSTLSAMNLATLPVLFFFSFMYYTDPGSTFFVLLAYLVCLQENHPLAAVFGGLSLFFRQTNIVWIVFLAGITFIKIVEKDVSRSQSKQLNKTLTPAIKVVIGYVMKPRNIPMTFLLLLPYGMVVAMFIAFVYVNKGIVLGDKQHHQAVMNVPQLFYFFSFTCGFASPFLLSPSKVKNFIKVLLDNLMAVLFLIVLSVACVYQWTYVHKYLLADNRHITNTIWRKTYQQHFSVKYLLIPAYLFAGWSIHDSLSMARSPLWRLVFCVCLVVATVPQKLLEFRYFILPYLIFRLNIPTQSFWKLLLEFFLYSIVNCVMILLFLFKTFYWENIPDPQRIMW